MPGGRQSFHSAFVNHDTDFDVTADVAIRFDAVGDMVNSSETLLSEPEKRGTYTLGTELGNLDGTSHQRWTIEQESDVTKTGSLRLLPWSLASGKQGNALPNCKVNLRGRVLPV